MTEINIILPRKNFDLAINEKFDNGITGIFGPSGSGKTSLFQAIAGLAVPAKGCIKINERVLFDSEKKTNIPIEKRKIGYVFQEGRLFPHMSVEGNLKYGIKKRLPNSVTFEEVVELLDLKKILKSKPAHISGGERQRTALGRSLLSSPEILLLDEPFSAVDTLLRSQILPFIIRIQKKVNIPILVISHDLPDLMKLTNKLCLLNGGKSIAHGNYYNLLKDKKAAELLGSGAIVNSVEMIVQKDEEGNGKPKLVWNDKDREVEIKCDKNILSYEPGQTVKVFINADDISLSKEKLENVSIRNQLKGNVTDVVERGSALLCMVDAGIKLRVEITRESQTRLAIKKGSEVWCLFKSVAIDTAG